MSLYVNGIEEYFDIPFLKDKKLDDTNIHLNTIGAFHFITLSEIDVNFYKNKDNFRDFLHGYIDDFRIYNRLFSFEDIKNNLTGSILSLKSDGISTFGNKGVFLKAYEKKVGIHTKNPESNLHIVGNTLITDGYLEVDESRLLTINNSNISSSNIYVKHLEVDSNIVINQRIDGVSHINEGIISNLDILEVLKSTSNVVEDERVLGDIVVDGVGYIEEGRISNLDILEILKSTSNVEL